MHGADVNRADKDGITALMRAAMKGYENRMHRLLKGGANPDATDRNGWTAYTYIEHAGHPRP
ncbi:MAG: ankyrin repeat domain-containing protein [Tannerella sp.]|nr:ankyrin repeat domain-containing protein [Tannerella sp.]